VTAVSRPASDAGGEGIRWGVCVLVAIALHVAVAAAIWMNRAEPKLIDAQLPALLIDLEPLPTPVAAPAPEPPKPPEPEPEKIEEPPPPPVKPAVVLHKPPPKPVTRPPEKKVEDVPPLPAPFVAGPKFEPTPAPAPQAAALPPNAMRNWEGEVMARLDRFKRYPRRAQLRRQEGVVYLRFTVARNGDVLSYALQRSSGIEALDEETLTLIERAKPLPPPPAEAVRDKIELVVPVRYVLR